MRWHPPRIVVSDIGLHSPGGRAQSTCVGAEVQICSDPFAKDLENPIALPRANALAHEKDVDIFREAIHKPVNLCRLVPPLNTTVTSCPPLLSGSGRMRLRYSSVTQKALHLPAESGHLLALLGRESFALAAVDLLQADPVAQGLLDQAKFLRHVGDGALLLNDQGCRVLAELRQVSPSPPGRRRLFFGYYWPGYLLFEVSGHWGMLKMGFSGPTGIERAPFRILEPFSHSGTIGPSPRGCLRKYWIRK